MEIAVEFTGKRSSFDRPISSYQGVSFPIAEIYTNITLTRNMVYHTADLISTGQHTSAEIAALKLFSSEMCQEACKSALMLLGGRGYNKSREVERLLRDSLALTIAEGTSQICKLIISNAVYNSDPEQLR
jgi:alkylation response protein AidB-like acyl-CoA dehydrogenase